jgi:type I restriction enzyme M protein
MDENMINKNTLPHLLVQLGFKKHGSQYSKTIASAVIKVDFEKEVISYPENQGLIVNERQTCNFSALENFVVLECVHRLLEKGYKASHIELEPKWKLGHGASGGRADILVKDNFNKPLVIIECKTPGTEMNKAWRSTQQDGDQLFSYAQQISETQFLCLYTSNFENNLLEYSNFIIAHRDNEKYLADNPTFKGFKSATDLKERFAVWRDTYKLDYTSKGIFEANIQPYYIGKDKYTLADLAFISASDQQKKYHEFATILRQHNISGRENAFDKLVNLFLCKLVDETQNPQELKFYWKGVAYDTHFELLDRLQQLYQQGMNKFLGEEITYINQNDVSNALRFIRQNPDATQRAVWNLFIQQKFFTNNDFSLIDVHNEKLFYQNAEVLLKILQMWQDIRLTGNNTHNQFLGDMFEGFLDQGVKQSEGQYFTPKPICSFILKSLPLEQMIQSTARPIKAIDYACGAGHFLNELALQLQPLVQQAATTPLSEYHKAIIGIEKEYRLSKIAKVSAFMYGQQDIAICYGDALMTQHAAFPQVQNDTFDLLVANPPFSVRGFLETLPEKERDHYTLTQTIDAFETNNSIETFFIERAKQLLKAGGVAAIILPSSILSNGNRTYVKTREIMLQYFDIIAIAELGSGTFGKTGTNTVTLFLRRKATKPDTVEHYFERVEEWFSTDENQTVYNDEHFINDYALHIGANAADYKQLLHGQLTSNLLALETFKQYRRVFDDSTETANLKKQKGFKEKTKPEQEQEFEKRFLAFVQKIERDKLLHFVVMNQQKNHVLIIKSPTDNKAQKQFLGYEWSAAKGNEGIQLVTDSTGAHQTLLYDQTRRDNPEKLNHYIAQNFNGTLGSLPDALSQYASTARLVDLLDFSRVTFDKQITLTPKKTIIEIQSKWTLEKLGNLAEIISGQSPESNFYNELGDGSPFYQGKKDFGSYYLNEPTVWTSKIIKTSIKGDILVSVRAPVGDVNRNPFDSICIGRGLAAIRTRNDLNPAYFFEFANQNKAIFQGTPGAIFASISSADLREVKIPLPPLEIQQKIVEACQIIDANIDNARVNIENSQNAIKEKVDSVYKLSTSKIEISKVSLVVQYGISEQMNESQVGFKIFRMNEIIGGRMFDGGSMKYVNISLEEFEKYKLNRGDILFNRTNSIEHVGKTGLFDLDGDYCFASYLVRVVPNTELINPFFLNLMMNSREFQQEAKSKATKSINQANINASIMKNIAIPCPTLEEQQRLVAEVRLLEQNIALAQAVIDTALTQKRAVMEQYL